MLGEGEERLNAASGYLEQKCKHVYYGLNLLIVISAICAIAFACIAVFFFTDSESGSTASLYDGFRLFAGFLWLSVFTVVLWGASGIFKDISRGRSPFTSKNIKRITYLGWSMILVLVAELIVSPGFFSAMHVPGFDVAVVLTDDSERLLIPVDIKPIVIAFICFGLSCIFEYGSLLQQVSDDTF